MLARLHVPLSAYLPGNGAEQLSSFLKLQVRELYLLSELIIFRDRLEVSKRVACARRLLAKAVV